MFFQNSQFSRAVIVLMGAGTLILFGIIAMTIWLATSTAHLGAEVLAARQTRTVASETLEALLNAETAQRGYLLTANPRYLQPYLAAQPILKRDLAALDATEGADAAIRPLLDHLKSAAQAKLDELRRTIALAEAGRKDEAISVVRSDQGIAVMDDARRTLGQIIGRLEAVVSTDINNLNRNALLLQWATTIGGIVVVLFGFTAMFLIYRSMLRAARARQEVEELNQTLESRVAHRTEALTRANDEIQRFAYIVSHDLRAPLVNIMGFTSELEVGTKSLTEFFEGGMEAARPAARMAAVQDLPEAVRFIRSSTGKMDRLINAILKLSREGRRELMPEKVDLKGIFDVIAASLRHQIEETQTTVSLSPHLPVLSSDRLALEQVFGNLFDNALKYLKPGRPGIIAVEAQSGRAFVTITIRDNGRGIAENDLERIFELFRRAGRQDKAGEGIGLAHVRALVRRLGGDISVSSKLGEGSEFRVVLPHSLPSETGSLS